MSTSAASTKSSRYPYGQDLRSLCYPNTRVGRGGPADWFFYLVARSRKAWKDDTGIHHNVTNGTFHLSRWLVPALLARRGQAAGLVAELKRINLHKEGFDEVLCLQVVLAAHRLFTPSVHVRELAVLRDADVPVRPQFWHDYFVPDRWTEIAGLASSPKPGFWTGRPKIEEWVLAYEEAGLDISPVLLNPTCASTLQNAKVLAERLATSPMFSGRAWAGEYLADLAHDITVKAGLGAKGELRPQRISPMAGTVNDVRSWIPKVGHVPAKSTEWGWLIECASAITGGAARTSSKYPGGYTDAALAASATRARLQEPEALEVEASYAQVAL